MLKQSTLKLLSWLYPLNTETDWSISSFDTRFVLSELSDSGRRSLLHMLSQKQLIDLENQGKTSKIRITSHGKTALEEAFPVFSDQARSWQGEWSLVLFLQAPKNDPQFRYVRSQLVSLRSVALTRGVYLYPGEIPAKLQVILDSLYPGSVIVVSIRRWQFGDERSTISKLFMLSDVVESLSGISKEVDRLLSIVDLTKESEDQHKQQIFLVFNRLFSIFPDDIGITKKYFPQVEGSIALLAKLQNLTVR